MAEPETKESNDPGLSETLPVPSAPPVPTLYPTETVFPPAPPTETLPPSPVKPTATPIDFSQISVEMRYAIPGLGLSRHLLGNVSNQIVLTDETTGESRTLSDQTGILIQLQQALPRFELEEMPDGCEMCVWLEYDVPLVGTSDAGWLRNVQLLASVENYTAVVLGPHFPPGTVAGLRRSATPYQVAHSVAITADDQLWSWTAIESEPSEGQAVALEPSLVEFLNSIDLDSLPDRFDETCPQGAAFETLFLRIGQTEKLIRITCPEYSLPSNLLPVYVQLDNASEELLKGVGLPRPEPAIPLSGLIYYQREDGARLSLLDGDLAVASDSGGLVYTSTLTSSLAVSLTNALSLSITPTVPITVSPAITNTIAISLVEMLIDSGAMERGLQAFVARENGNMLVVRAVDALYEVVWEDLAPAQIREAVVLLNELLEALLERAAAGQEEELLPAPTPEATPSPPS